MPEPLHRGTVFIVDDDPAVRDALSLLLSLRGFPTAVFGRAEDFLLNALEPEASFEAVAEALAQLPVPNDELKAAPPADMVRLSDGTIVSALDPATFPARLAALRVEDHTRSYAHACYLWTVGGENFEPLALIGQALPSPYLFSGLLTGRFDAFLGAGAAS